MGWKRTQNETPATTVLKRFEEPDEVRTFEKGNVELVHIGGMTIGRATNERDGSGPFTSGPAWVRRAATSSTWGWWSPATAAMEEGTIHELRAGTLFQIAPGPPGHDRWVVGDEPYVSLHFLGADHYATK